MEKRKVLGTIIGVLAFIALIAEYLFCMVFHGKALIIL